DFRYIDEPVLPGELALEVSLSTPFKVEQTTQVDVALTTPLKKGEEVYIIVEDSIAIDWYEAIYAKTWEEVKNTIANPFLAIKKLDYKNQITTMQITPYRGSAGTKSKNYPIRIWAFKNSGGVFDITPKVNYKDTFMYPYNDKNELGILENFDAPLPTPFMVLASNYFYQENLWMIDFYEEAEEMLSIPANVSKYYDCYSKQEFLVAPEEIKLYSASKCVETLYERFPNFSVRLVDADNPNDINDPNAERLAVPFGHTTYANYNAHQAGIEYLFTGRDLLFEEKWGNNFEMEPKVIVQVNEDGSFLYWYWQDYRPFGVLDSSDVLSKSPYYPNDPNEELNKPTYNEVFDTITWINTDCSKKNIGPLCDVGPGELKYNNEITPGDYFRVNGINRFEVLTFGVNSMLTTYGQLNVGDPGGEIQMALMPRNSASKLKIRVYTDHLVYDYNNTIEHPPHFINTMDVDPVTENFYDLGGTGIDYCGTKEFKVLPPDPYVNFTEMRISDHSLQFSETNYTTGDSTHPPMIELPPPTPQISFYYDPIVKDVGRDFRAYTGGNTHFMRAYDSKMGMNMYFSYPAIWWWYWYDDIDTNEFTDFNKLGMEFGPMSDYGYYFILQDGEGNNLTLDPNAIPDRRINRIIIEGPFKRPLVTNQIKNTVTVNLGHGLNLPTLWDWSGKLVIDQTNRDWYEFKGKDWTQIVGANWAESDQRRKSIVNTVIKERGDLNYIGLDNIIVVDEIVPVGAGIVSITVELGDGTLKKFQDCCAEPPTDGVISHGLSISNLPEELEIEMDHVIEVHLEEHETFQDTEICNNAYVFMWQDRGIRVHMQGRGIEMDGQFGFGDSYVEGTPMSSAMMGQYSDGSEENAAAQYTGANDINEDGKIAFADYETEIMGTYDLASNTWQGGLIDGRTFNVNGGKYVFSLASDSGNQLVDVGTDIGFITMSSDDSTLDASMMEDADHVVSEWEVNPIYISAYKYGDDNNDRAFVPIDKQSGGDRMRRNFSCFSHEVYLAGQARINPVPHTDLSVSVNPTVLTAGCVPEMVDPSSPLTFRVTDEDGRAVDLTKGADLGFMRGLPLRFRAEPDAIWEHLFVDEHPDPLPEHYWLRTDLHNKDTREANNNSLYSQINNPFNPISIDFSNASVGQYVFRGFCANDKGQFDVEVYSSDRKHKGIARVNVELPDVEYKITNTEDPSNTEYMVPGEPDFVLTAADNRIYRVNVTVRDARGLSIKGVTKGVSTCGGGIKNTARFTVYSNRPESWNFSERDRFLFADHFMQDLYPYNLNVGFDFNDNQRIDWRNAELFNLGGFNHIHKGLVYYNTTLVKYDNGEWDVDPNYQLPPFSDPITQKPPANGSPKRPENPTGNADIGWGLGAIYNSAYHGGNMFVDADDNGKLTYTDSLGLDVNGQTTFYVFAEDVVYMGGLVGQNAYCNTADEADVCGNPPPTKTDPGVIYKRFNPNYSPDGVFFLDWEAFPNREIQIAPPNLKV
ncbi:MAG: hypothetical protein KAH01_01450, partial [Caldisericia bacterium]|nr:hypothetical protein [Caldisericia bacterium]